jgi:hypothetical protein
LRYREGERRREKEEERGERTRREEEVNTMYCKAY